MDALGTSPKSEHQNKHRKSVDFLAACNNVLVILDVAGGIFFGFVSGYLYVRFGRVEPQIGYSAGSLLREVMLGSVVVALILREPRLTVDFELYAPKTLVIATMLRAAMALSILLTVGLITRNFGDTSRSWLITWCGLLICFACASRVLLVRYLHRLATRGALREAIVVIGAPDVAGKLAMRLAEKAMILRVIDNRDIDDLGESASDAMTDLMELARAGAVDTVVVAMDASDARMSQPVVQHLSSLPIQVALCSDVGGAAATLPRVRLLNSISMSVVADRPMSSWGLLVKSILDKIGAALLMVLAGPFMVLAGLAVALDSPGPIIFRQRRNGWTGELFTIYKFRTMRHEPNAIANLQATRHDPRCTRVGFILRRMSLDEMPQLWNVLRGEMSLVGPRPHVDALHVAEKINCSMIAEYAQRQRMKPGLTGWAQIHGARGAATTPESLRRRIAYDLHYIDHWSLWLDVAILARTPWVLLRGHNAY